MNENNDSNESKVIRLDRDKRLTILKWLKQGFITVGDIPELHQCVRVEIIDKREQVDSEFWENRSV